MFTFKKSSHCRKQTDSKFCLLEEIIPSVCTDLKIIPAPNNSSIYMERLCHVTLVLPRLVDSLVVRLRLCWESPGPVPEAWLCV